MANGNISAADIHGKNAEAFLAMSTAQLFAAYQAGGKERSSAALEFTRRKLNRSLKRQAES